MTKHRSFRDVLENNCCGEIFDALSGCVGCHADRLDLFTYRVESHEHAEVSDISIKAVYVRDEGGFAIGLDVIVSAEIAVPEHRRSDVKTYEREQWFSLVCSGEVEGET